MQGPVFKTEIETTEVITVSPAQASVELTSTGYVVAQSVSDPQRASTGTSARSVASLASAASARVSSGVSIAMSVVMSPASPRRWQNKLFAFDPGGQSDAEHPATIAAKSATMVAPEKIVS